jgi:type I restriction-modification system DNA methylase subunit
LLKEFNLHTIVRLPNGVFAPYTSIPTNILFFDRSGPTREVWYYEQPLPEGRKNYTKTAPIQFEGFAPLVSWWDQPGPASKREENDISGAEQARSLKKLGCEITRQTGSHLRLTTHEHGQHHVTIPNHDPIKMGTLSGILTHPDLPQPRWRWG